MSKIILFYLIVKSKDIGVLILFIHELHLSLLFVEFKGIF